MSKMVRVTVNFHPMVFEMVDLYVRDNVAATNTPLEKFIMEKVAEYLVEDDYTTFIDMATTNTEFGLCDTITAQGFGYKEFVDFSEDDDYLDDDDMGGIKVTLGGKDITPDIY